MKKVCRMLVLGVLAGLLFGGMLWAEEGGRSGALRGTFVRLVERAVGERGYMGIVIKPFESDDHVTVLVPRQREELWQAARRLQEGQKVGVSFMTEAGHKFIKGMEAERRERIEERQEGRKRVTIRREVQRREGSREEREAKRPAHLEQMQELKRVLTAHLDRMAGQFRELRAHVEQLKRELQELRAENERLKRQLRERSGPEREREREVRRPRVVEERREVERRREGGEREEREIRIEVERRREGGEREGREIRIEVERRREGREREGRDEGRATRERPKSEREVVIHQLEVMRMALPALKEAERGDAVELLTLAIRAREVMLEGRKDEEAQSIRERSPSREQLVEILSVAAKLWREFGKAEKSAVVGQLAEQLSGAERRQVREREERDVRREGMEREERDVRRRRVER